MDLAPEGDVQQMSIQPPLQPLFWLIHQECIREPYRTIPPQASKSHSVVHECTVLLEYVPSTSVTCETSNSALVTTKLWGKHLTLEPSGVNSARNQWAVLVQTVDML